MACGRARRGGMVGSRTRGRGRAAGIREQSNVMPPKVRAWLRGVVRIALPAACPPSSTACMAPHLGVAAIRVPRLHVRGCRAPSPSPAGRWPAHNVISTPRCDGVVWAPPLTGAASGVARHRHWRRQARRGRCGHGVLNGAASCGADARGEPRCPRARPCRVGARAAAGIAPADRNGVAPRTCRSSHRSGLPLAFAGWSSSQAANCQH
jgi:hypothetical protein